MGSDQKEPICINLTIWPSHIGRGGLDIGVPLPRESDLRHTISFVVFLPRVNILSAKFDILTLILYMVFDFEINVSPSDKWGLDKGAPCQETEIYVV